MRHLIICFFLSVIGISTSCIGDSENSSDHIHDQNIKNANRSIDEGNYTQAVKYVEKAIKADSSHSVDYILLIKCIIERDSLSLYLEDSWGRLTKDKFNTLAFDKQNTLYCSLQILARISIKYYQVHDLEQYEDEEEAYDNQKLIERVSAMFVYAKGFDKNQDGIIDVNDSH